MPWGCFVEMPVERGISIALGMQPVDAPRLDATGFGPIAEERYAEWAHLAADALGDFQALYVHIKGPDVPAHDGRAEDKRDVISAIDRAFFGDVLPRLGPETVVAVTADHATSCLRKAHTADPVPLLASGRRVTPDGTSSFGERACADRLARRLARPADPAEAQRSGPRLTARIAQDCGFLPRFARAHCPCPAGSPRTALPSGPKGPIIRAGERRPTRCTGRRPRVTAGSGYLRHAVRPGQGGPVRRGSARRHRRTRHRDPQGRHRPLPVADLLAAVPSRSLGARRHRRDLPDDRPGDLGPAVGSSGPVTNRTS